MIFPIAYFGSIRYFKELVKADRCILELCEHFPKQTYRNRTDILTASGIQSLSIPVIKPNGNKTLISDLKIDYSRSWQMDHWRAIKSAYSSAPYFDYYGMEVQELIMTEWPGLVELNTSTLNKINEWLELGLKTEFSKSFTPIIPDDHRKYLIQKNHACLFQASPYMQIFPGNQSFHENLSILDGIFCEGPTIRKLFIK